MMTKKILFLLTFLLTTLGGGNFALAESVTFNTTSGNLTSPQDEISLSHTGSLQDSNLKITKGSTLNISTSSRFIQSIEMTLKSGEVYATQYVTANVGSTAYDDTNKKYTWTGIAKSIVFTNANEDAARDFRIVSVKVTYTTTDPSLANDETVQTYPYTWDFNSSADLWASSIEQLSVYTDEWNHITDDGKDEYRPKVERTNWGYNIDIVKGLRFDQTRDWKPCLDYKNGQVYVNSTTITIPNVKAGQKISVTGNVSISTHTNTTPVTETEHSLYEYTVDADGDVTLTFGESWIKTISVLKTDVTLTKKGTWPTTKTYGDAAFTVSLNYTAGTPTTKSLWTIEKVSGDDGVITWSDIDGNKGFNYSNNWMSFNNLTPGAIGSVTLRFKFIGNDAFNPAWIEETFTVNKTAQNLSFEQSSYTINYGTTGVSHTATLSPATGADVEYSSSDPNVATVNESGLITTVNSGTCTITATAAETAEYAEATANYKLTVKGSITPTITMKKGETIVSEGAEVVTTYDNSIIVKGESSEGLPVKYRSDNTSIATVDANGKIVTKNGGTVKIYVYTEGSEDINPVETYYNLVINPSSFSMTFVPNSGTINIGKTITPYVTLPSVYAEDVTEITASSNNTGIATVVTKIWDKNNPSYDYLVVKEENGKHKIERIKPTITGIAKGTTTISLTLSSSQYITSTPAIYTITVADDSNLHFDWADKTALTMYEGDYMMMPAITGNANGYPFDQNDEQHYVWAMTQKDGQVKINWYNTSYHPGEGEPFYWLTDNGGGGDDDKLAYILYAQSSEARTGTHPEGLMIYARKAGTVKIHAKDMQLDKELSSTITLTILPKANIYGNTENDDDSDGQLTVEQKSITYPYTWDFTKDFSTTDLDANSYYWTKSGSTYSNGLALQNSDYADDNHDGTNAGSQRLYKAILANGNTIPAFKGMTVQLQGTYFNSKYDKITLKPTAGDGNSHLHVNGGPQYFQLPAPATSGTDPEAYRVYVKAKPTQSGRGEIRLIAGGNNSYWFENAKGQFNDDGIYWAPVVRGQDIKVAFQDVDVYWIAVSTEAKELSYFAASNPNLTYAAAAYSYNEDLDLTKSNEVNGATAYYASGFTVGKDTQGDYSDTDATDYAVVMKPLSNLGSYVKANTGMLLKYDEVGGITADTKIPFYMIANPKNVATYDAEPTIDGSENKNYLVGTGASTPTIGRTTTIDGKTYTNFMMSAAYKYYANVTDPTSAQGDYHFDRDWSFYPVMNSGAVAAQKSYLQIPGDLYVNRNGEIVDMPTSARAAFDVESAADDTAEAPATKAALSIVFDDSVPATPEDPATEEPEDGNSDKDKDRPRKPGDDGWPKPPFPPFPPIITDIDNVNTETTDNAVWHSMEGVRISQPTKPGLYIRNGKKVVIK